MSSEGAAVRLLREIDPRRDHVRGGGAQRDVMSVVVYGDYLCPYCRRIRLVLDRLRKALGDRLAYAFRQFPDERAHPGADFASRAAEAAGLQDRFWQMHDALYTREPPLTQEHVVEAARAAGLDMERFARDVDSAKVRRRVADDLAEGRRNGVTATPTIFIDGMRYDGAWDFYSMLEALERPVGAQVKRTARAFASLPASAGLVLLAAAALGVICANTPLAPLYRQFVGASFGVGPPGGMLSLTVGGWFSEGLLAIFFLLVGLEIRREMTAGALADRRAAVLPILAALGGVLAPAAIYLSLNRGATAHGWAVPTATDVAFTLGVLALLGARAPSGLKVFVAALAVVDDFYSMVNLAIFYPQGFHADWLAASGLCAVLMLGLNRSRVYATWPYLVATIGLWLCLHAAGLNAALAGVVLAAFLPTRPTPAAGPLLAQAATALAALEQAESAAKVAGDARRVEQEPIWDWASRNLSAASDRLLSPAEGVERAIAPWGAYLALPLFAFSATGVALDVDLSSQGARSVLLGVVLGLVVGKPLGVGLASLLAIKAKIAIAPSDVTVHAFIGAAMLCGVGDTVSLLLADQAFPGGPYAGIAKIGVLIGSILSAALGAAVIATARPAPTASVTSQ